MVTIANYFTPTFRRFWRGAPIVVVSGLPRSGTSMAMGMLAAGGMPIVTDGIRRADPSNPRGYYELERVKELHQPGDHAWLADARGKAIKIVSFFLTYLPDSYDYQVVFMRRHLREIVSSQNAMLDARGEARGTDDDHTRDLYEQHLEQVERFLARRRGCSTLMVDYAGMLADPPAECLRIQAFLGRDLDLARMARAAEPTLYRHREPGIGDTD